MPKRLFDILCASVGLLLLLPLGVLIALLIKLSDGGPVLYGQMRVGQFGRPFRIWKFRSMVTDADKLGPPLTQEEDRRITPVGRFLRKTKLDELPQLWNVLTGEMAFVGPRPEVPRYVDRYTPAQREVLRLRPGVTDLASMLFRNEQELLRGRDDVEDFYVRHCLPRKIEFNLQYARHANLLQDAWIILQTLCPYWLAVLSIYSACLVASLWATFLLRSDFQMTSQAYGEFRRCVLWVVCPQLAALVWLGKLRGLMSYFSLPEVRRTVLALGVAGVLQAGLLPLAQVPLAASLSIVLLDFVLSVAALSGIRMALRSLRQLSSARASASGRQEPPTRIAIVGTGELATSLALHFGSDEKAARQVVAFFGDDPRTWNTRPHDIPVVGLPECLLSQEWLSRIDEVIVALPEEESVRAEEIGNLLRAASVKVSFTTWPPLRPFGT